MSKKSSTFAPAMTMTKKKYEVPVMEIISMGGGYPLMAIAGSKDYSPLPERRPPAF